MWQIRQGLTLSWPTTIVPASGWQCAGNDPSTNMDNHN